MTTRLHEQKTDPVFADPKALCVFCGERPWDGMWAGQEHLYVCRGCATDVMPRLMADAVWRPGLSVIQAEALWVEAEARFWRALYAAQVRPRP